jgi:hypothetical protein
VLVHGRAKLAGRFVRSKIEIIERLLRINMLPHELKDHIVIINLGPARRHDGSTVT